MTSRPGEDGTPGLQLHLVDSDDEPMNDGAGERRPSTASLSRFRSCPQLSTADGHDQDSPGSDDHGLGPELLVSNVHFTHGSPRLRQQRVYKEQAEGRSQTPTPPSTPGSKRSHVSLKEALGGGASGGGKGGAGDLPTSRAIGRARLEHALLGRTASQDSPDVVLRHHDSHNHLRASGGDQFSDRGSRVLSEFYDEPPEISIDDRLTATEDGASTPLGERGPRYHGDTDSMDKCARWLQSLKMTSNDRLKSRSHIQLPPI